MDISTTATATATVTATNTSAVIKTSEAETETPGRIQTNKAISFSNGVLKRHHSIHHHQQLHIPPVVVTYKECLKNHAASLGGHSVDGCGEFMPSPTAIPTDPTSLKCAACCCHRNFHRREEETLPPANTPTTQHVIEYQPHHRHHPPPPPPQPGRGGGHSSPNSASPPPISSAYYPCAPHMLLALSAGVSGPPPEINPSLGTTAGAIIANPNGRKRFRTKFTQDQKERMHDFAEKVGWKMQKRDEELIREFCSEVGVEKGVLKVWMHNNKSTIGKKDANNNGFGSTNNLENNSATHFNQHNHNDNDNKDNSQNLSHHFHNNDSVSPHVVAANGSSSSS